jgi:hypothetical protein
MSACIWIYGTYINSVQFNCGGGGGGGGTRWTQRNPTAMVQCLLCDRGARAAACFSYRRETRVALAGFPWRWESPEVNWSQQRCQSDETESNGTPNWSQRSLTTIWEIPTQPFTLLPIRLSPVGQILYHKECYHFTENL